MYDCSWNCIFPISLGIPLINQPAYIDPIKYGDPEKAVRKFAKEIDRREVRLEGLIGEGKIFKGGLVCNFAK